MYCFLLSYHKEIPWDRPVIKEEMNELFQVDQRAIEFIETTSNDTCVPQFMALFLSFHLSSVDNQPSLTFLLNMNGQGDMFHHSLSLYLPCFQANIPPLSSSVMEGIRDIWKGNWLNRTQFIGNMQIARLRVRVPRTWITVRHLIFKDQSLRRGNTLSWWSLPSSPLGGTSDSKFGRRLAFSVNCQPMSVEGRQDLDFKIMDLKGG